MNCESGRCFSDSSVCGMYGECSETRGMLLPRIIKYVDTPPKTRGEAFDMLARTLSHEIEVSRPVREQMVNLLGWA